MNYITAHRLAVLRALAAALLAVSAVFAWTMPGPVKHSVQLLATYGLKDTQVPGAYITDDEAVRQLTIQYVQGFYGDPPLPVTAINYPASLRPFSPGFFSDPTFNQSVAIGLAELQRVTADDPAPVIFGFSQGAVVGSEYKKNFNQQYANPAPGTTVPQPTFVFLGNPDRPHGGSWRHFPGSMRRLST